MSVSLAPINSKFGSSVFSLRRIPEGASQLIRPVEDGEDLLVWQWVSVVKGQTLCKVLVKRISAQLQSIGQLTMAPNPIAGTIGPLLPSWRKGMCEVEVILIARLDR